MASDNFSPEFVIVSDKVIAERADEIYVERGCADGFDREDWLRAERELKSPAIASECFRAVQRDDEVTRKE